MKCPQCDANQRYKDGMTCTTCGYRFAINPKKPPHFSDMAMKKAVERISGFGQYAYTYTQLFARIHRILLKKKRGERLGCAVVLWILAIIIGGFIVSNFHYWPVFLLVTAAVAVWLTLKTMRHPMKIPEDQVTSVIAEYMSLHRLEGMATGQRLPREGAAGWDDALFEHAPEGILIVEWDDMAEMLILNRFHLDRKILVVSANRYPPRAFRACRKILERWPDLPVSVIHDASRKGHRLRNDLLNDPAWGLRGRKVRDLGLHPLDVSHLKRPLWVPERNAEKRDIIQTGKPLENVRAGYRMPLDIAGPKVLMGATGLAMVTGAALLSEALLEEQRRNLMGGGFGGGNGGDIDFG